MLKTSSNGTQATAAIKFSLRPTAETLADLSRPIDPRHLKTFYPEPDYSVTPVAETYPEISAQYAKTEEEREQILRNEPTIRDDSWYDWRVQNWGTKWDVFDCCNDFEQEVASDEFSVGFCTAWAPLSEQCMAVISNTFPGSLLINYYEESDMDFCGVTVAKNGVVMNHYATLSDYREPFVRQQFPDLDARLEEQGLDLEDDLDEFFWDHCDCGEFSDFIRDAQESVVEALIQEIEEEVASSTRIGNVPSETTSSLDGIRTFDSRFSAVASWLLDFEGKEIDERTHCFVLASDAAVAQRVALISDTLGLRMWCDIDSEYIDDSEFDSGCYDSTHVLGVLPTT